MDIKTTAGQAYLAFIYCILLEYGSPDIPYSDWFEDNWMPSMILTA